MLKKIILIGLICSTTVYNLLPMYYKPYSQIATTETKLQQDIFSKLPEDCIFIIISYLG